MNVEFPDGKYSKVLFVNGEDVIIERKDGREFRVSGPISLTASRDPVFDVNFGPENCASALSDGDIFRLRWRLGAHYFARMRWFTEHLPSKWPPPGKWFYDHTEENQLVISNWFTFIDNTSK